MPATAPTPLIDLRSDTVTRPTAAMREAMLSAPVGDDVYGEDPTANLLESTVAARLGKEAALFVPSGTMANELAIRLQVSQGDEVVCDADSHIVHYETGAVAALAQAQVRGITTVDGRFDAEQIRGHVRPAGVMYPESTLLVIENTHNRGGGTVWSQQEVAAASAAARSLGLGVHLDGARLWNAEVASGTAAASFAQHADTVSVCFSKGLGAPIGSALCGSAALIAKARRLRKQWGGGMRQVGFVAAAALFALEHHVRRLSEDHTHARVLADSLKAGPFKIDTSRVHTNMVYVDLPTTLRADTLAAAAKKNGVLVHAVAEHRLRLVTHLDVSRDDVSRAALVLTEAAAGLRG